MDIICLSSWYLFLNQQQERQAIKKHIKNVTLFIMPDPMSLFCYTRNAWLKEHAIFSSLIKAVWPQDVL